MFTRPAAIAALILSAATGATLGAASHATPLPHGNWWEKVVVTVPAGGEARCTFSSSREAAKACAVEANAAALADAAPDKGSTTTITFERRFTAGRDADTAIGAGEMLLGGQVMKLAIGSDGKVAGCAVIEKAEAGMEPDYGCDDAKAELFSAGSSGEALLTVLIYAHNEQVV